MKVDFGELVKTCPYVFRDTQVGNQNLARNSAGSTWATLHAGRSTNSDRLGVRASYARQFIYPECCPPE